VQSLPSLSLILNIIYIHIGVCRSERVAPRVQFPFFPLSAIPLHGNCPWNYSCSSRSTIAAAISAALNAGSLFPRGKFSRDKVNVRYSARARASNNYRLIMRGCQAVSDWFERTMQPRACICQPAREHSVWSRCVKSLASANNARWEKRGKHTIWRAARLIDCLMTAWLID